MPCTGNYFRVFKLITVQWKIFYTANSCKLPCRETSCVLKFESVRHIACVLLILLLPLLSVAAETMEKHLSLRESITVALENASSLKKAENARQLQGSDVLRSYGGFLPKISASAGYIPSSVSRSYGQNSSGVPYETSRLKTERESVDLSIVTSLNLFNGFRDYATLQSALKSERSAELSVARARQSVAFDVIQSYYQVLLNQEVLAIARENLLTAKDQLTLSERQFHIGLKALPDLYQQQAETARSELSANQAEAQLERSRLELLRRLRLDPRTRLALAPLSPSTLAAEPVKPDIDSLISLGLQNRSDIESRKLDADAAKWQIRQAASARYPKLDLNVNISTGGIESLRQTIDGSEPISLDYPPLSEQLENSVGYTVSLNMSWAIFDGFQTRYNVEQAKIKHLNRRLDYEDLQSDIAIDLQQAALEYRSAAAGIASAKAGLRAAKAAYEAIKRKYDLGASGFVELSTARAALFGAMSTLSQATYNLALQKEVLDYAAGTLKIN